MCLLFIHVLLLNVYSKYRFENFKCIHPIISFSNDKRNEIVKGHHAQAVTNTKLKDNNYG